MQLCFPSVLTKSVPRSNPKSTMPLKITALPLELLFCIASYLNFEDFVKFGKTKILGEALHDERINKEMVKVRCQTH